MTYLLDLFSSKSTRHAPKRIMVVTDPGRDPDDEVLFAQLAGLTRLGYAEIAGVIVNQTPCQDRAKLAKATFNAFSHGLPAGPFDLKGLMVKAHLNALGLHNIPVAMGSEGDATHKLRPYEFQVPYLALARNEMIETDGQALLKAQMERALRDGQKITLLLVSGMKDADIFIKANPDLAGKAIESIQIMGGVEIDKDQKPLLDQAGRFQPDNAANNKFGSHENDDPADPISKYARSLYAAVQDMDIPTTIITRHAAYKARVAGSYYNKLAETGHPVGIRLRDMQKAALVGLFEDVTQPGGHPNARLTPEWFADTFLHDPQNDLAKLLINPDCIMDCVKGFNPYDPMTALSTFFPRLFNPYGHTTNSTSILGLSPAEHGIIDVAGVHQLLDDLPRIGFGVKPHKAWEIALASLKIRQPQLPTALRRFEAVF